MRISINKGLVYTLVSATLILLGTVAAIQYARGSLRITQTGTLSTSGLLNANSYPTGAEVMINGKLVTATDDTINLEPGEYDVEIIKDGYIPWKKRMVITQELVSQTNARLFPAAPSLDPLTLNGVSNPIPSPDGQKIVYFTASASAERRNGIYIIELTDSLLSLQSGSRQIVEDDGSFDLSQAQLVWSPDSSEILLSLPNKEVILSTTTKNDLATLSDVSFQKKQLLSEWEQEMFLREREFLMTFPEEIVAISTESARNVYLSPDKKKMLYTADATRSIPENIVKNALPSTYQQKQSRVIQPGGIYVYDREEDTNYLVGFEDEMISAATTSAQPKSLLASIDADASTSAFVTLQASDSAQTSQQFLTYHTSLFAQTYQWFPDSKHLLFSDGKALKIMSYDGTNTVTIYTGPFYGNFVYPWPNGSKVVVITTLSSDAVRNFYAINLD